MNSGMSLGLPDIAALTALATFLGGLCLWAMTMIIEKVLRRELRQYATVEQVAELNTKVDAHFAESRKRFHDLADDLNVPVLKLAQHEIRIANLERSNDRNA